MVDREEAEASTGDVDSMRQRRVTVWVIVAIVGAVAITAAIANRIDLFERDASADGDKTAKKAVAVRVAPVARGALTSSARHPGELDAQVAEIAAQVSGRLLAVEVDIGDRVKRGDVLARIDVAPAQREVSQARASVRTAEASRRRAAAELKSAQVEHERGKLLRKEQIISAQELDALESRVDVLAAQIDAADAARDEAKARVATLTEALRDARLKAPFDGAVAERYLDPGALVEPARTILRLVKSGPLGVRFRVPERELARVSIGMKLGVVTHATGEQRFAGKVTRIGAEVSRTDRTAIVEGVLDAETEVLRPGMYAEVELELGTLKDALIVPSAAIVERSVREGEPETGVFVIDDGVARWKQVAVRGRSGEKTAIEGVSVGTQVVTLGHDGLKDGARVQITPDEPR